MDTGTRIVLFIIAVVACFWVFDSCHKATEADPALRAIVNK